MLGVTKGVRRSDLIIEIINEIFNENINKIVCEVWGMFLGVLFLSMPCVA